MQPQELKKKIDQGEDVMLVDVREADEYAAGDALQGAQNMPMGKVFVEAKKGNLPKDKKIVVICKAGGRCEIVSRELQQQGYNIEHLEGGIDGWRKMEGENK